jgi:hypothetical protein
MEHRVAHQSSVLPRPSCEERGRLSALHRGFSVPGAVLPGADGARLGPPIRQAFARLRPRRVQPLRAVPRSRDGRRPGASRRQACEACLRAPHPLPPAMTPHESALGEGDDGDYNPIGINVKGCIFSLARPHPEECAEALAKAGVSKDGLTKDYVFEINSRNNSRA